MNLFRAPQEEIKTSQEKYQVALPDWTGPYDVLLQVIEERELNLLDLDISSLLEGYLDYLQANPSINLDEAGDFLVVAATLAQIKSKLLLPKDETEVEEEEHDPREELVRYLMEYQKIKQAAELLRQQPLLGRDVFLKGAQETFEGIEGPGKGNLFQLVRGFQKIMRQQTSEVRMSFTLEEISVSERLRQIFESLKLDRELAFDDLVEVGQTKTYVIITFLATLELVRLKKVKIFTSSIDANKNNSLDDDNIRVFLRYVDGATEEDLVHSEFDAAENAEENAETLVEAAEQMSS